MQGKLTQLGQNNWRLRQQSLVKRCLEGSYWFLPSFWLTRTVTLANFNRHQGSMKGQRDGPPTQIGWTLQ